MIIREIIVRITVKKGSELLVFLIIYLRAWVGREIFYIVRA